MKKRKAVLLLLLRGERDGAAKKRPQFSGFLFLLIRFLSQTGLSYRTSRPFTSSSKGESFGYSRLEQSCSQLIYGGNISWISFGSFIFFFAVVVFVSLCRMQIFARLFSLARPVTDAMNICCAGTNEGRGEQKNKRMGRRRIGSTCQRLSFPP